MKVAYKKRFIRDLNKIPVQTRQKIQETVFEQIPNINDFQEIRGLKKIQGFSNFFRLRVSDYIIGIYVEQDKIIFCRVMHRKDIYKYFP